MDFALTHTKLKNMEESLFLCIQSIYADGSTKYMAGVHTVQGLSTPQDAFSELKMGQCFRELILRGISLLSGGVVSKMFGNCK